MSESKGIGCLKCGAGLGREHRSECPDSLASFYKRQLDTANATVAAVEGLVRDVYEYAREYDLLPPGYLARLSAHLEVALDKTNQNVPNKEDLGDFAELIEFDCEVNKLARQLRDTALDRGATGGEESATNG